MRRLLLCVTLAAALAGVGATAAPANQNLMFSVMMDDDQLLYRGDDARDTAMRRMKQLGVDTVRVTVLWSVVAEHAKRARNGKKRRNFEADNPRTYPRGNWDRYDRLVRAAQTLGLQVYFNITGPGPRWAHSKPPKSLRSIRKTYKPKPREFFKFVKALGRRYDGTYRDENDGRGVLPRVSFWSIYNEPNQGGWLTPQYQKSGRTTIPWSPVMYRELWYYGRTALGATGHGGDIILIGETAPVGGNLTNPKSPIRPKKFIRELFCVSSSGRPYTGASARKRKCALLRKIEQFQYTAWAHHPYTKELGPTDRDSHRDSITMANVGELTALLDQIAARTGLAPAVNYSMQTEFGWETKPDPFVGISLPRQAEWINVGDYLAWKEERVLANAQFMLRDAKPLRRHKKGSRQYWFTYQSGLFRANGKPKPAASAYTLPIHVVGKGTDSVGQAGVNIWGWVRFLPPQTPSEVVLQFRPAGTDGWSTIGDPVKIDHLGVFQAHRAVPTPGTWRAVWTNPVTGTPVVSREVDFDG